MIDIQFTLFYFSFTVFLPPLVNKEDVHNKFTFYLLTHSLTARQRARRCQVFLLGLAQGPVRDGGAGTHGHSPLVAAYLHRIGRRDSAICPHCHSADETVEHLVFQCPAHDHARRDTWPGDTFTTDPRRLWSYLERFGAVTPLLLQELVEDVAVATSSRHADLSLARRFAVASPRFIGRRSASTVLSQDCLGRPALRLQSPLPPTGNERRERESILTNLLIWTLASLDTRATSARHSSCSRRISAAFCLSASTAQRRASSAWRLAAAVNATFCSSRARSAATFIDPPPPPPPPECLSSSARSSARQRSSSSRSR